MRFTAGADAQRQSGRIDQRTEIQVNKFYDVLGGILLLTLLASGAIALMGYKGEKAFLAFMLAQLPLYGALAIGYLHHRNNR